eukprot:12112_1
MANTVNKPEQKQEVDEATDINQFVQKLNAAKSSGKYGIETVLTEANEEEIVFLVDDIVNRIHEFCSDEIHVVLVKTLITWLSTSHSNNQQHVDKICKAVNNIQICTDEHGHRITIHIIQTFGYPRAKFIWKTLMDHPIELAIDSYGGRVLNATFEACPLQNMSEIFICLAQHTNVLIEDKFGHLILEFVLLVGRKHVTDLIKAKLCGKFARYAQNEYAYYLVDKCNLKHSMNESKYKKNTTDWSKMIISELLDIHTFNDLMSNKHSAMIIEDAFHAVVDEYNHHPRLYGIFEAQLKLWFPISDSVIEKRWLRLLNEAVKTQTQFSFFN